MSDARARTATAQACAYEQLAEIIFRESTFNRGADEEDAELLDSEPVVLLDALLEPPRSSSVPVISTLWPT
jgi:hypothetical protein